MIRKALLGLVLISLIAFYGCAAAMLAGPAAGLGSLGAAAGISSVMKGKYADAYGPPFQDKQIIVFKTVQPEALKAIEEVGKELGYRARKISRENILLISSSADLFGARTVSIIVSQVKEGKALNFSLTVQGGKTPDQTADKVMHLFKNSILNRLKAEEETPAVVSPILPATTTPETPIPSKPPATEASVK